MSKRRIALAILISWCALASIEVRSLAADRQSAATATRDVAAAAAAVDALIEEQLRAASVPPSSIADDGEFLRRASLDITGRIPTFDDAREFLADETADKRRKLIDTLLDRPGYGQHFATIWREQIVPRDAGNTKSVRDPFSPWLAEQFNGNRGWNQIVFDLLTAEGNVRQNPQTGFVLANSESFDPQANLLADATSRLFWGVQLRCAECHDHPFAPWKQTDFWSTAAFFSRLRRGYTEGKNPTGFTFTEAAPDEPLSQKFGVSLAARDVPGLAVKVPTEGGKLAGRVIPARFLGGAEADWTDEGPYRPRFARWATSGEHPYFAANAANRLWAHFFDRGLVNPLDEMHDGNPPSHPELLQRLSSEFFAADFDLKHLVRVMCNSQTYQRTSQPAAGNEQDTTLFSHMAVKVVRPEVLHDSLSLVLLPPQRKSGSKGPVSDTIAALPGLPREEFVRFFGTRPGESAGSIVNQGIPQILRLMNGGLLADDAPGLSRFTRRDASPTQVIESFYLAAYARCPTANELAATQAYLADRPATETGYAGVLWALLNSSEFVLNH